MKEKKKGDKGAARADHVMASWHDIRRDAGYLGKPPGVRVTVRGEHMQ